MTIKIIEDVINGSVISEDADGVVLTRSFLVDGMGDSEEARNSKLPRVLELNGIPDINDRHPYVFAIRVKSRSVTAIDSQQFKVLINYANTNPSQAQADDKAPAQISIGSNLSTVLTNKDKDGKDVEFDPSSGSGNDEVKNLTPQPVAMNVNHATYFVKFTRKEKDNPISKAQSYTNKLNSSTFMNVGVGLVYCSGITGESADGGESYTVTYNFEVDMSGWNVRAIYNNTSTGKKLGQAWVSVENKTEILVDVYNTADFNGLNLN